MVIQLERTHPYEPFQSVNSFDVIYFVILKLKNAEIVSQSEI